MRVSIGLTMLRQSLDATSYYLFAYGEGVRHKFSRMIEYSIPSLLSDYGADIKQVHYGRYSRGGCSHLGYLFAMRSPIEVYRTDYLNHLDMDSISELIELDRWLMSIMYLTFIDFRNLVNSSLGVLRSDILPVGMFTMPELFLSLKGAIEDDRNRFFNMLCTYGSREILQPFIGAGLGILCKPLEWSDSWSLDGPLPLHPKAFQNFDTFSCLNAVGLRMQSFEVVLQVMSSRFIIDRAHDQVFLDAFFGLWSPSAEVRPLTIVYWLLHLRHERQWLKNDKDLVAMFDTLVARNFCSFPNSPKFLGVELLWLVCIAVEPRWHSMLRIPKETQLQFAGIGLLSHLIQHYRGFVDLELDHRLLRRKPYPYWPTRGWVKLFTGYTPLMLAVVAGNFGLVALLVDNGADVTLLSTILKSSALDLSIRNTSGDHPRKWVERANHFYGQLWFEGDWNISETTDRKILDFLMERSGHSHTFVANPNTEHTPSGKLLDLKCR